MSKQIDLNNSKSASHYFSGLEELRGISALLVIFYHIILFEYALDPEWAPKGYFRVHFPGHLSVLVFFVLSGFVIGINNRESLDFRSAKFFLKKRLLRLYPIYLIALLLTVIFEDSYDYPQIISHIFFLQVPFQNLLKGNEPLWSLHYEMVYYLLFMIISFFSINTRTFFIGSFFVVLVSMVFRDFFASLFIGYCIGVMFWFCGYYMAVSYSEQRKIYPGNLKISLVFLWLCSETFNLTGDVLKHKLMFGTQVSNYLFHEIINYNDLGFVPISIVLVVVFANIKIPYLKFIFIVSYLIPAMGVTYLLLNGSIFKYQYLHLPFFFFITSGCLLVSQYSFNYQTVLNKIGAISYAMYAIHMPILLVFNKIKIVTGTVYSFAFRLVIFLTAILLISYFLEILIQPRIKKIFK